MYQKQCRYLSSKPAMPANLAQCLVPHTLSNSPLIHRFLDSSLLFCAVALKLSLLSPSRVSTNCWSRSHYSSQIYWEIFLAQCNFRYSFKIFLLEKGIYIVPCIISLQMATVKSDFAFVNVELRNLYSKQQQLS